VYRFIELISRLKNLCNTYKYLQKSHQVSANMKRALTNFTKHLKTFKTTYKLYKTLTKSYKKTKKPKTKGFNKLKNVTKHSQRTNKVRNCSEKRQKTKHVSSMSPRMSSPWHLHVTSIGDAVQDISRMQVNANLFKSVQRFVVFLAFSTNAQTQLQLKSRKNMHGPHPRPWLSPCKTCMGQTSCLPCMHGPILMHGQSWLLHCACPP